MVSESLKGVVAQILCNKIGGGRITVREILLAVPAIANLIREGRTFQIPSMIQTNKEVGMVPLDDALMEVVEPKRVQPVEAYVRAAAKGGLEAMMKARGVDMSFLKNLQVQE
jgi:twitching motility protein PilT